MKKLSVAYAESDSNSDIQEWFSASHDTKVLYRDNDWDGTHPVTGHLFTNEPSVRVTDGVATGPARTSEGVGDAEQREYADHGYHNPWIRTKCVFLQDCWPVNLTDKMRSELREACPGMEILYIPAGYTGQVQVILSLIKDFFCSLTKIKILVIIVV